MRSTGDMLRAVAERVPFIDILDDAVSAFGIERVLDLLAMICEGRSEDRLNDRDYWLEVAGRISQAAHPHEPWF